MSSKQLNEAKPFDPNNMTPPKFSTKGIGFTSVSGNTGSGGSSGTELAKNNKPATKYHKDKTSNKNFNPNQMC